MDESQPEEVLSEEQAAEVTELLRRFSAQFDERCQQRHDMGARKYGQATYLDMDTLEMALEEVIDLANYARYTFVRIRLLQEHLGTSLEAAQPSPGPATLGKGGFISLRKDPS